MNKAARRVGHEGYATPALYYSDWMIFTTREPLTAIMASVATMKDCQLANDLRADGIYVSDIWDALFAK